MILALAIGLILALGVGVFGTWTGFDRDRAFYPTVTVVVAHYYVLFAVMGGSTEALVVESLIGAAFVVAAVVGFRRSLWIAAVALAAHGVFDFGHDALVDNPGKPSYWPPFCAAFDVVAAAYLAWRLARGHGPERR